MSNLPQEIDDYIKESIDHTLGLPISTQTLQLKLAASEATQQRLESQCLSLQSKLNQHILSIKSAKEEAKLSAQGLKKVIAKNEQLAEKNSRLVDQCKKLKAVANRGKLVIHHAKKAETRVRELEDEAKKLTEDLNFFKEQYQMRKFYFSSMEELLVETALADLIGETGSSVGEFLLANMENESCRRLLHLSQSLRPSTLRALSLAAKIKTLEKDNQQLRILLYAAQGEVKLLSDEIDYLLEDKKKKSLPHVPGKPPARSSSVKLHGKKRPWEPSNSED